MDRKVDHQSVPDRRSAASIRVYMRRFPGAIRRLRTAALDLVFPRACIGCRGELAADTAADSAPALCRSCITELALFAGPTCARCAAAVPSAAGTDTRCHKCRDAKLWFDEALALGEYTGLLRQWLLHTKRNEGDALSLAIAELIWQQCRTRLEAMRPDVVVAVPMYWRRRWRHGTNSASLLAEILARRLRVPLATGLLRRKRNTPPQFTLPPSERRANVRRAFCVRAGYHLSDARVLLVDDILTTGATCSEAARVLKRAGAVHVAVVVAGRTMHG